MVEQKVFKPYVELDIQRLTPEKSVYVTAVALLLGVNDDDDDDDVSLPPQPTRESVNKINKKIDERDLILELISVIFQLLLKEIN